MERSGEAVYMLEKLFGIHESALQLKAKRVEVLSQNIANADTPGFKARDIDFRDALRAELGYGAVTITNERHFATPSGSHAGEVYRIPYNTSVDGNTVEIGLEQARFGKAASDYQATLDFLQGRVTSFKRALKGE
jgi:flagellar basal-body rod protein FlgB